MIKNFNEFNKGIRPKSVRKLYDKKVKNCVYFFPLIAPFLFNTSASAQAVVRDEFTTISYSGNNGTQNWLGNWIEVGESDGVSAGSVDVENNATYCTSGNCINIHPTTNRGAYRIANLAGATFATLTFDWKFKEPEDNVFKIQVSTNGSSWTDKMTIAYSGSTTRSGSETIDISSHIAATTYVRFIFTTVYYSGSTTDMFVDNIEVEHNGISPGGVSGAIIWLKANQGVTTGATFTWSDQSGNSRNGVQSAGANQPTVNSTAINFNPALTFDGTNDYLSVQNLAGLPTGTAQVEQYAVANNQNVPGFWQHIFTYGTATFNQAFGLLKQNATANAGTTLFNNDIISSALEFTNNVPTLLNGKYTGADVVISSLGKERARVASTSSKNTANGYVGIDPTLNLSTCWNGNIPEIILFSTNLTATQAQQVNTYLAIKYGITLDQSPAQNYIASNGTTVYWNGTTNSSHNNNIAGIARDDNSALTQKQSKSVNTGLQVVIGNGNTIAASNTANASTFSADQSALVWGDNAGSVSSWTATGAPSSRQILARTWKVQETGTVGSVKIKIADNSGTNGLPAEATTVYLLVDADGNFSAGATSTTMTLNGTSWEADVDLTNGQFFTFATQIPIAPGGVYANNLLWLKPDAGTLNGGSPATNGQNVTTWQDQSVNGNNFTTATPEGVVTGAPTWSENSVNYNPGIAFNGTQGLQRNANLYTNNANFSIFNVHRNTGGSGNSVFAHNSGSNQNPIFMNYGYLQFMRADFTFFDVPNTGSARPGVYGATRLNTGGSNYTVKNFFQGLEVGSTNVTQNFIANNNKTTIGYRSNSDPSERKPNTDHIHEVIVYNATLTTTEQQRVNTYLALKYGTSLDQTTPYNYLASDGTTVFWNGTTNATYKNNIAGIARDDASGLSQKQSKSVNSGLQVAIGNGNTIAATNTANANTFSVDKSALVWGDNAAAVSSWAATGAPPTRKKIDRNWRLQESGTVGSVKIQIADNSGTNGLPAEETTVYLLLDADGNFAAGATEIAMTLNGTNWEVNVDLTNGQYFSFATEGCEAKAPVLTKR
jgi:hypothetical protein